MLSAQEGLSALCVEVDVNDWGTFLLAEHDERDSFSRPYGEGNGLAEDPATLRLLSVKGTLTETPIPGGPSREILGDEL
jgi:hypothetical protein